MLMFHWQNVMSSLYLSAGSVGMSVRSAVNAVLTELVRSLSRALAAVL